MAAARKTDPDFALLFAVMLVIGAGNTALQSVLPAIGRSLGLADSLIALAFSVSAFVWVIAAPRWAKRSDSTGRRRMIVIGMVGYVVSVSLCALFLTLGIDGVIGPVATIVAFIFARVIYGYFGSAAPPAAQAMIASRTTRAERTKALTLLGSAFGLGTILGPALAPFMIFPIVGLAGPAYMFALFGAVVLLLVATRLRDDAPGGGGRGAATSYPSIGGNLTGASVTAATTTRGTRDIALTDARIWPWLLIGIVLGHAQAMTGQAMGFLVIDRLGLPPELAQQSIGIVLMTGACAALLVQWGLIPLLNLSPRSLCVWGLLLAGFGCLVNAFASTLLGTALGFALASAGFGLSRPGYTAGSSLAVGPGLQNAVAGKVTAVNGASFVLGPFIGVALYELWHPLPYLGAALMCVLLTLYSIRMLPTQAPEAKKGAGPEGPTP